MITVSVSILQVINLMSCFGHRLSGGVAPRLTTKKKKSTRPMDRSK